MLPAPLLRLRSDEQLVALLRGGCDEAFSVIHDRYRPRLMAYCRQMVGSHADAEDVLQDVFVRAHAGLRANDHPIALRAWLYRIAHNRCVDGLRRPAPMPSEIMPGAQPALSRGSDHDPPVEAERSEDLARLVSDLLALPEQQRSALLMRELQGLTYEELAVCLGVSVGAVKSLLVRARDGMASAAVARAAPCADIRLDLAAAHDRGVRPSGQSRRHLRECAGCREHRAELRRTSRQLAGLAPPAGLLAQLGVLSGLGGGGGAGAGAGGGLAAAGSGSGAVCGAAGVAAGKVAVIVCAAALVGGAGMALTPPAASRPVRQAPARAHVVSRVRLAAVVLPPHTQPVRRPAGAAVAPAALAAPPPSCPPASGAATGQAAPVAPGAAPAPAVPASAPAAGAPATAAAAAAAPPGASDPAATTSAAASASPAASTTAPMLSRSTELADAFRASARRAENYQAVAAARLTDPRRFDRMPVADLALLTGWTEEYAAKMAEFGRTLLDKGAPWE